MLREYCSITQDAGANPPYGASFSGDNMPRPDASSSRCPRRHARPHGIFGGAFVGAFVLVTVLGASFAGFTTAALAAPPAWDGVNSISIAQAAHAVDIATIAEIQQLLARRGLDPGPADGIVGARTIQAIEEYQRDAGIATTGVPSRALLTRLRIGARPPRIDKTAVEMRLPAVAAQPQSDSRESTTAAATTLANTSWRFLDSTGARFDLRFRPDGTAEHQAISRYWKWRQSGREVEFVYDNGLGVRTVRKGAVTGPGRMAGSGGVARGKDWTWTAERLPDPSPAEGKWP